MAIKNALLLRGMVDKNILLLRGMAVISPAIERHGC
jgi:hypothetical protein